MPEILALIYILGLSMIYIREKFIDRDSVTIQIDGVLDRDSIALLRNVYEKYVKENKEIALDLEGIVHISREGMDFLKEIDEKASLLNPPEVLRLKNLDQEKKAR